MPADDDEALRRSCKRFVHWHGLQSPGEQLSAIPADTQSDRSGDGGVVQELESEVTRLLGKPASAFLPSGTMAQLDLGAVLADAAGFGGGRAGRGRRYARLHARGGGGRREPVAPLASASTRE